MGERHRHRVHAEQGIEKRNLALELAILGLGQSGLDRSEGQPVKELFHDTHAVLHLGRENSRMM